MNQIAHRERIPSLLLHTSIILALVYMLQCNLIAQGVNSIANFKDFYAGGVAAGFGVDPNAPDPGKWRKTSPFQAVTINTQSPGAGTWHYEQDYVSSTSYLLTTRSFSASIEADYLTYSGLASFEATQASELTTGHTTWLVQADRDYGIHETIDVSNLQLTPTAQSNLTNYSTFVSLYGTEFISAWDRKAHISAIFDVSSRTESDSSAINAMFAASAGFVTGDASAAGAMSQAVSSLSSDAQATITISVDGVDIGRLPGGALLASSPGLRDQFNSITNALQSMILNSSFTNGFISTYYLTPYAAVLPGFPNPDAIPKYPEQKKALSAWELAKATELQCQRYLSTSGPRHGLLDTFETAYLKAKFAECVAREDEVQRWLKAFDSDQTLLARNWSEISIPQFPDIRWGAYRFFNPINGLGVIPIRVEGGAEVGGVTFKNTYSSPFERAAIGPVSLSQNALQSYDSDAKLKETRLPNGSLVRWYWMDDVAYNPQFPGFANNYAIYLKDRNGNQITYAFDKTGSYVTRAIGTDVPPIEESPLPDNLWTFEANWIFGQPSNPGGLVITDPIDGGSFQSGDPVPLAVLSVPPYAPPAVNLLIDGVKIPGNPFQGVPSHSGSGLVFGTNITGLPVGTHSLAIESSDGSPIPNIYGPVSFTVKPIQTPPTISAQPQSINVQAGDTASFCVTVSSSGPVTYQWFHNGVQVFDNVANVFGTETSCMTIFAASAQDTGRYDVVASDANGTTTSAFAFLKIGTSNPITITSQPVDHVSSTGKSVQFAVTAANATGYQWLFNGTPLPGETQAVLNLSPVTANIAGTYTASVSNTATTTNSTTATLIVVGVPEIYTNTPDRVARFGLPLAGPVGAHLEIDSTERLTPSPIWGLSTNFNLSSQSHLFLDFAPNLQTQRYFKVKLLP